MFPKRFLIFCLLFCCKLQAQTTAFIDSILSNRLVLLQEYKRPVSGNKSFFLKMDFGKPNLIDTTGLFQVVGKDILSVDLLFTDYPSSQTLKPLNTKRFQNLIAVCPYLLEYKNAQWQVVRQMKGNDKESAEKLLHGFMINYREKESVALRKKELDLIKDFDKTVSEANAVAHVVPLPQEPKKKVNYWAVIHGGGLTNPRFFNEMPVKTISANPIAKTEITDSIIKVQTSYLVQTALLNKEEVQRYSGRTDSLYLLLSVVKKQKATNAGNTASVPKTRLPDSSLFKMLERNSFNNILMVTDVTLSMAEYTVQALNWLMNSTHQKNVNTFTCFNDGDDMPNEHKKLNATGGVYGTTVTNVHALNILVENVMQKGSGGDVPENVCEALLKSMEMCSACSNIVLIADNWAPIRDISLLNEIKKPIHVFICGGSTGTHVDYINLAYQTHGSLHFEDVDFYDLSNLKDGIRIRGVEYKLNEKGFAEALRH